MASTNTFVWRLRLCLVLIAVGLVVVDAGKDAAPLRQQFAKVQKNTIPVKNQQPVKPKGPVVKRISATAVDGLANR